MYTQHDLNKDNYALLKITCHGMHVTGILAQFFWPELNHRSIQQIFPDHRTYNILAVRRNVLTNELNHPSLYESFDLTMAEIQIMLVGRWFLRFI